MEPSALPAYPRPRLARRPFAPEPVRAPGAFSFSGRRTDSEAVGLEHREPAAGTTSVARDLDLSEMESLRSQSVMTEKRWLIESGAWPSRSTPFHPSSRIRHQPLQKKDIDSGQALRHTASRDARTRRGAREHVRRNDLFEAPRAGQADAPRVPETVPPRSHPGSRRKRRSPQPVTHPLKRGLLEPVTGQIRNTCSRVPAGNTS